MDNLCRTPLWQTNLTWDIASNPDFTPCFQETVLTWSPCFALWLFTPVEVILRIRNERRYMPVTLLNLFKTFLTTILCLLSIAEYIATEGDELVSYITPIIKSITFIVAFGLHMFHRKSGIHTSGLMFLFWLLMAIMSVINVRSLLLSAFHDGAAPYALWEMNDLKFTLRIVAAPIVIVQLFLAAIADKKAEDPFLMTGEDYRHRSPENDASILSSLTFWWLNSLMWLGYKRSLTQEDLYAIKRFDRTEMVSREFDERLQPQIVKALDNSVDEFVDQEGAWISLAETKRPNSRSTETQGPDAAAKYVGVTGCLLKTFWPLMLAASGLKFASSLLTFASPLLLGRIITFVSSQEPSWRGLFYAMTLFFLSIFESLLTNREQYFTNLNVMRVKTCLTSSLYRKTLKLSNYGRKHYTTGQIVNLMSTDTQRVADVVQNVNIIWSAPLQIVISMFLLYQQLGWAILSGLGVIFINIPFNAKIAIKLRQLQGSVMKHKDKRIKLLSEIFNGIKIIKIHAWEDSFKTRVESHRMDEIRTLIKQTWYSAAITFAFTCLPFIVALASFATYVLMDGNNILDANKVFVSLALFNIIRVPLALLPMLITNLSMFLVSVRRINKFFESDEVDPNAIKQIDDDSCAVKITNASFKWDRNSSPVLENINICVPRGKLVAVVGPVGSGKSSLVSAMLGDLEKYKGEVMMDNKCSVAYVPQEAWILNNTLKNNIMLNKVLNEDRYQRVLDACALLPDLKTLDLGDQSEIGEKGLNLSGGQKQRVSLARAVYADTDIYLMDDPLNAVDAHVGRHIFDHIIGPKGMLRGRTRVLVTNKLSILPEVDHIIVMKDGQISESGTYENLLKNRGVFSQLLVKYLLENSDNINVSQDARADLITKELARLEDKLAREDREKSPAKTNKGSESSNATKVVESKQSQSGAKDGLRSGRGNLTEQEVTQVGSIGLGVHLNFIRTMGMNFMIALAIYIMSSAFTISSNIWLSDWSNDASNVTLATDPNRRNIRLGVYAGLGLGESICVIASTILLNFACLRGSKLLHNRMLARVLRAPMSWFNTTPSGRIMNRFSKDIDTVDVTIRFNVRLLLVVALRSVTSLILISVGSVYSIILIVPIVILYFLFQMFYVSTSRQLKRIESTTKSPIYSHFNETIQGTSSIRAFGVTQEFTLESSHRIDVNNSSYYISFVSARWLAIRLEFLGFIVVLTASLIAVLSRGIISPGIAGLSVTYSLTVTTVLSFLVRTYSDYETNVVSVERLLEYTRTPVEPDDDAEPLDPDWPAEGRIQFDDLSAKYRPELDLVLKDFSLDIRPSERVGLVGRTGSGKSTITLTLFRIVEAYDGRIIIDDVDISQINLKVLRSKLSIIPQEPVMFSGTLRQNVDPTESHTDDEIWRAIDLAHLGQFVRSQGLDREVAENGGDLSVGQKQLFCLARTLLRRSKILVLDEATAAVDVETDSLIQQTIRKEFKDSTILTIAHRLETIQDYDRVVVMDRGGLVEEGAPDSLLRNRKSKFYDLAKEAGLTN